MAVTYEAIATQTLSSTSASVTFSSIPSTYTDLVIVASVYSNTNDIGAVLQLGSSNIIDTGSNYSVTLLKGTESTPSSARQTSQTSINIVGYDAGIGSSNGIYAPIIINLMNYSQSNTYKTSLIGSWARRNSGTPLTQLFRNVGLWRSSAVINTLSISTTSGSFVSGSSFTIYGIKAA